MTRQGNNPKRRVIRIEEISPEIVQHLLAKAVYVGSGHHKRYPLDYGFERTNPVPSKSLCDMYKPVILSEAKALFEAGIKKGMVSDLSAGLPKYVWSVNSDGIVFEAKTDPIARGKYHGYPLENDLFVRDYILSEWEKRCC